MLAIRLTAPTGIDGLAAEQVEIPRLGAGEALVRVHAAGITRDELTWPVDRLPAIPSYELSGTVVSIADDARGVGIGDAVFALLPFDRDGAAAEYAVVPADLLAPKPSTLGHVESAAVPLAALSAWQGLLDHGRLQEGERVLIHGAAGGVGHLATQLARWRGAYVIGTASGAGVDAARSFGAHEALDRSGGLDIDPVDLVFDTVGGAALARSADVVREGGRVVSVAEEPPAEVTGRFEATYFVVEPNREQLVEIAKLIDEGALRPAIDSVYPLSDARAAFERLEAPGKRGKVVLAVVEEPATSRRK
jgi:NADPH:quinone reductase-like Zn-dependent oxidoreductase